MEFPDPLWLSFCYESYLNLEVFSVVHGEDKQPIHNAPFATNDKMNIEQ